jgi:DMSO/TMAO reductase YedYZ molybdopterin-dependent catalytic subunit
MEKVKSRYLWLISFFILAMVTLMVSCAHNQLSAGSPLPPQSTESTPSPTNNGGSPTPRTYEDLNALKNDDPDSIDNSKFPITPVEALHLTALSPQIDMTKYQLLVDGLVNTPLSLGYDSVLKYPPVSEVVLLVCPGVFVDNAEWTGVPVKTLLAEAGVKPEATRVAFHAMDGFKYSLTLEEIQKDGVFLAYRVNGQILPADQGYPVRLVVKGRYGGIWLKWVDQLEVEK